MTGIQWTDETWNPVTGCTKVSEGCRNCYAEALAPKVFAGQTVMVDAEIRDRNSDGVLADGGEYPERLVSKRAYRPRRFTDVRTHADRLDKPLHWRKPRRVFVNSMSDLFHEEVPDEFIDRVFAVMALSPQHTFQVLTKRPERMRDYCETLGRHHENDRVSLAAKELDGDEGFAWELGPSGWHLPNVWLGVSVEDQATADERIPILLDTPAAVRFVSAEPLLGPVTLREIHTDFVELDVLTGDHGVVRPLSGRSDARLDWVIVGGESGRKARPCDVAWIRSIVEQCQTAGVACFVKQLGADAGWRHHHTSGPEGRDGGSSWLPLDLTHSKGGDPAEWPEDLRVREWPA